MADQGSDEPAPKRVRLSKTDVLKRYTREDIHAKWEAQEAYLDYVESKHDSGKSDELAGVRESEAKLQQQQQESTRRENVLVMRLATKEQEIQELLPQIHELKNSQSSSALQLRSALLDPAVNLLFQRVTTELDETKAKLSEAQDDMRAWKFTPDSVTGKKLMAKCRGLIAENQELGKQLSQGRIAQLEAELALQKKYSEQLKASQDELNEFIEQLDEEVDGMQSTIMKLQGQLRDAKQQISDAEQHAGQASMHSLSGCMEDDADRHEVADDLVNEDCMDVDRTGLAQQTSSPSPYRTSERMHSAHGSLGERDVGETLVDDEGAVVTGASEVVVECPPNSDGMKEKTTAQATDAHDSSNGIENFD